MDENEIPQESDENDSIPELIDARNELRDDTSFVELYDEIFNEVLENAILDYMQAINLSNLFISSSETFMNTIMNNNRSYEHVLNESFENQPQMERTDHIVEVETFKYSDIKNEIDDKDCSICLNEFDDDCEISILTCTHIFHKDCLIEWGKYKQSCPVCREEI